MTDIIDQMCRAVGGVYDGSADPVTTPNNWARANAAIRAALTAAESEGWVLVPKEPTEEMWMAGREPILAANVTNDTKGWSLGQAMDAAGYSGWAEEEDRREKHVTKGLLASLVYRAMIQSSPEVK